MRLLRCWDCCTIEEIPGEGPLEPSDPLLHYLVNRHQGPVPEERVREARDKGVRFEPRKLLMDEPHLGDLGVVPDQDWRKHKAEIVKEMWKAESGFDSEFYAAKNTFSEDAFKCFNRHGRPKGSCVDFMEGSKKISGPGVAKPVYLCHFCPVFSFYLTKSRDARGMYDKQPGEGDIPL